MNTQFKQLTLPNNEVTMGEFIGRLAVLLVGWIGTVTFADLQNIVTIVSGLAIFFYTISNTYVLWRDQVLKKRRKKEEEETGPADLET